MKKLKLIRLLTVVALLIAPIGSSSQAAPPPGPYFNGFEKNTAGWFDSSNGGDGTITRRPSGYSNSGGYADGIASAAGNWHARLTGEPPCTNTPAEGCFGPFTRWGGYSSTFPSGGYLTQVDIYLDVNWAATHLDYRFDWSSAINSNQSTGICLNSGNPPPCHLRDFVFNAGTSPTGMPPGFFVNSSTNATRSGAFPENLCPNPPNPPPDSPCRTPAFIGISGWYTFRHTFRNDGGFLAVDFDIFPRGSNTAVAHWTIHAGDSMATVGGNRYGWFVIEEIPDLAIDNSLRTSICHEAEGDGEVEGKDSGKAHFHFKKNSCRDHDADRDREGDNVQATDEGSGTHFQSTAISSATFALDEDTETITVIGTGLNNGVPVGFMMIAEDNGSLAPGIFTLILTDGYSTTGSLTNGTIVIR